MVFELALRVRERSALPASVHVGNGAGRCVCGPLSAAILAIGTSSLKHLKVQLVLCLHVRELTLSI